MAKLFDIEGRRANLIKGIFVVVVILVMGCILWLQHEAPENKIEDATEYYHGIHVKGAVENPGFYQVPPGTRINDLEKVVGTFSDKADLDGINLAEYVHDGQEIYIPYKGTKETGALNLNRVTFDELLQVEGIGENYARKIISYRNDHGRYEKVIELKDVLGSKVYEDIRESFYVE